MAQQSSDLLSSLPSLVYKRSTTGAGRGRRSGSFGVAADQTSAPGFRHALNFGAQALSPMDNVAVSFRAWL
jgi:hypothetical protein